MEDSPIPLFKVTVYSRSWTRKLVKNRTYSCGCELLLVPRACKAHLNVTTFVLTTSLTTKGDSGYGARVHKYSTRTAKGTRMLFLIGGHFCHRPATVITVNVIQLDLVTNLKKKTEKKN